MVTSVRHEEMNPDSLSSRESKGQCVSQRKVITDVLFGWEEIKVCSRYCEETNKVARSAEPSTSQPESGGGNARRRQPHTLTVAASNSRRLDVQRLHLPHSIFPSLSLSGSFPIPSDPLSVFFCIFSLFCLHAAASVSLEAKKTSAQDSRG